MRPLLGYFLITLLRPLTSLESPVINSPVEADPLTRNYISNPSKNKLDSLPEGVRPERSEPEDGSEDDYEEGKGDQIGLDVSETLEKINPLTIASQVSQLFRKSDSKHCENKKSSERGSKCGSKCSINEDDSAVIPDTDQQPSEDEGYNKESKSGSRDSARNSGPSVVVIEGDRIDRPLKLNENVIKDLKKSEHKSIKTNSRENDAESSFKNELRIPKEFSFFPEFPIYDGDISFVPDPLHGLLDPQYWNKNTKF